MYIYSDNAFADIYESLLQDLHNNPEYETAPRGSKVRELTNVCIELTNPFSCLYKNEQRCSMLKYIAAECKWYFSGSNSIDFISEYAKMWKSITNEDGTVNSAYGYQLFSDKNENGLSEWQWAVETLKKDKDSRQAIMHVNKPNHNRLEIKDYPCTLTIGFMIRDNMLNMTVHMRSNDVILGLPTDIAEFCIMFQQMYRHLKRFYTELEIGKYVHLVDSMHLYEQHFKLAKRMLSSIFYYDNIEELDIDLIETDGTPIANSFNDIESRFIDFINTSLK